MFTGIVESTSKVLEQGKKGNELVLTIETPAGWELAVGQSIAVHGTCLTITSCSRDSFSVTLVDETLTKTIFGKNVPEVVNLERALQHGSRLDGHMVQGHVDTTGIVSRTFRNGLSVELTVAIDKSFDALLINKGSVAINGVSLTVVRSQDSEFSVVLIPHTLEVTTLGMLREGDAVNIEFDIIGKYLTKQKE